MTDRRQKAASERTYSQTLIETEKQAVLDACNSAEFRSLPPSQIVPILADRDQSLASESSFYTLPVFARCGGASGHYTGHEGSGRLLLGTLKPVWAVNAFSDFSPVPILNHFSGSR